MNLSYLSVQNYYENFRTICIHVSEDEYNNLRQQNCEYEEYFYLARSKRTQIDAVFDAHNFLTFDYNGHLYNILMPSLQKYKQQFSQNSLNEIYLKEFLKFKRKSHISKLSKQKNNILKFWDFLESSILRYKGVSQEKFPLYLKEFEFKFNHTLKTQEEIIQKYYFSRGFS